MKPQDIRTTENRAALIDRIQDRSHRQRNAKRAGGNFFCERGAQKLSHDCQSVDLPQQDRAWLGGHFTDP